MRTFARAAVAVPTKQVAELNLLKPRRWWMVVLFLSWNVAYAVAVNSASVIVLPYEVKRIQPSKASQTTGLVSGFAAVFQLAGLVGIYFSDTSQSIFGRRRPFVVAGTFVCVCGCVVMFAGDLLESLFLVIVGFYALNAGLSIGSAALYALIPDVLPARQHGMGSGVMALHGVVGSGIGYALFATSLTSRYVLWVYVGFFVVFAAVTAVTAREQAWSPPNTSLLTENPKHTIQSLAAGEDNGYAAEDLEGVDDSDVAQLKPQSAHSRRCAATGAKCAEMGTSLKQFLWSYGFSPRRHPDFLMLMIVRFFTYTNIASLVYMQYFYSDVIGAKDATELLGQVSLVTLGAAVLVAVPVGIVSDRIGRKLPMLSGILLMAVAYVPLMCAKSLALVFVSAVIYGFGNGVYSTSDIAMACDTLPSKKASGVFLAEFSIAMTLGLLLGEGVNGLSLEAFAVSGEGRYTRTGYLVLFSEAVAFLAVAFVVATFIRQDRGKKAQVEEEQEQADAEVFGQTLLGLVDDAEQDAQDGQL
eukprot:TRINITY_DN4989_c0_g1_i1.p1 TRINITY_DN4989_c0_g1~~TRINITY_DN4989_c0_g1_i1.p1  ORF type:complete len:528 (+),score=147.82 TRINITY_DN4989_c0_g1_i1:119-1702(+)